LAITSSLVQLMRGKIRVKSAPGEGSTFSFTACFATPATAPATVPKLQKKIETGRPLRILVAEDNLVNQKLIRRLLEKLGHQVEVANNGREAVIVFAQSTFDLIIMDIQMPELDGLEAAGRIRAAEDQQGLHTPIVALTANAMVGDEDRCMAAGMDAYLSKPVQLATLASTITRLTNPESPDAVAQPATRQSRG
jgi:CheY-like chemotaxis protein